jgi:WD40 repeat protein
LSVAFSIDGKKIASSSKDNTIKIWDADNGNDLKTLSNHLKEVTSVCFSPDGNQIISGSGDGTIKIFSSV